MRAHRAARGVRPRQEALSPARRQAATTASPGGRAAGEFSTWTPTAASASRRRTRRCRRSPRRSRWPGGSRCTAWPACDWWLPKSSMMQKPPGRELGVERLDGLPGRLVHVAVEAHDRQGVDRRAGQGVLEPADEELAPARRGRRSARSCGAPGRRRRSGRCACADRRRLSAGYSAALGGGRPWKESATHTVRLVSPRAIRLAFMKMQAPPRQTPASMRSPGTSSSSTVWTQCWMLSMRRSPIIDSARAGQSRPTSRCVGVVGLLVDDLDVDARGQSAHEVGRACRFHEAEPGGAHTAEDAVVVLGQRPGQAPLEQVEIQGRASCTVGSVNRHGRGERLAWDRACLRRRTSSKMDTGRSRPQRVALPRWKKPRVSGRVRTASAGLPL